MRNDTGRMGPKRCPTKSFVLGYNDLLSGAGFRAAYEAMSPPEQRNYEYGRICALELVMAKRPAPELSPSRKLPRDLPFFNLPPAQAPNPELAFAPNLDHRGFPRPIPATRARPQPLPLPANSGPARGDSGLVALGLF